MTAVTASSAALPAELVLETFRYLAIEDRIAARRVCRTWRALAAACPVVITEEFRLEPARLRCYLDQMRGAPLLYNRCINFDKFRDAPSRGAELATVLAAHMDRTVILDLAIFRGCSIPEDLQVAVVQPAPLLERLRLEFSAYTMIYDVKLFGHCAPRLTHCSVYACWDIVPALSPFKTIHVLVLLGVVLYRYVEPIFSEFPVLEELSLCISLEEDDGDWEAEQKPPLPPPLQPPPTLRHLTIASENGIHDLTPAFAWIQHEPIEIVCVWHYKDSSWRDYGPRPDLVRSMLDLLALPAVESLVVSCASEECAIRFLCADGRARVHAGIYRETLAGLLKTPSLAANVTDLVLSGVHALYAQDLVPMLNYFKALRSFTLVLRRLSSESEPFSASLCIPPIHCPDLESVTLGITQADYKRVETVILTAKEVREFLRDKLREDLRGKLKMLYLRGVAVEDVSCLRPCAEEICERPYEPLTDFVFPEHGILRFDQDIY